jgi:hypothetical protein
LFQENLSLKEERQELLERIASLENRLSQLISLHSTQQSLSEALEDFEVKITHVKSLMVVSPPSQDRNLPSPPPIQSFPLSPMMHDREQPLLSTPIHEVAMEIDGASPSCHGDESVLTSFNSPSIMQESIMEHTSTELSNYQRPKRACTSVIRSYQEPNLQCKLRRNNVTTTDSKRRIKVAAGLQDITNKIQ